MKMKAALLIACTTIISLSSPAHAITEEKRAHIMELMELTHAEASALSGGANAARMVTAMMRKKAPNKLPEDLEEIMANAVSGTMHDHLDEFRELYIDINDKYYSDDDVQQLCAFYKSPIGKKLLAIQPALTKEIMERSSAWAQKLQPEINQKVDAELKERGYAPPTKP